MSASKETANFYVRSLPLTGQFGTPMRYRTVLFDLDGTLLDHFAAIHRTHCQTTAHFGLPTPTMDEVRRAIGGGLEEAVSRIFGASHAHLLPEAVKVYRGYWPANLHYQVSAFPGAETLLQALTAAGVRCGVFTNKHGPSARAVLEHLGLARHLQGTFGALDTPWLKPQVEFAQHALNALGADAATTCLVGDSTYDIEAAHNGGFPCFCVTTGTHSEEELRSAGADGVYPDLATLGRNALGIPA